MPEQGFNDYSALTELSGGGVAPPGIDPAASVSPPGGAYPKDWYKAYSLVFSTSEENTIFPDYSSVGVINSDLLALTTLAFAVEQKAWAIHRDMDNMDANDPIIATALDTLVNASLGVEHGGAMADDKPFRVICKDFPVVEEILDDLCDRADIYNNLSVMARNAVKFGSEFREVVIDESYQSPVQKRDSPNLMGCITRFDYRPEHTIWPNHDVKGNKIPGYIQRMYAAPSMGKEETVGYEEWQLIGFYFGEVKPGSGKGTGLFHSCRRVWKKLQYLEEGLILARLTRAYPKLLHKVPVPRELSLDSKALELRMTAYKNAIQTKRQMNLQTGMVESQFNPLDVTSDLFVPRFMHSDPRAPIVESDVTVLEASNVQLTALEDVKYLQDKIITRSSVPRRYLGVEEKTTVNINRNGLDQEDTQFARVLKNIQLMLSRGLRKLFNDELAMHGYDPNQISYEIKFPTISTIDRISEAELMLNNAQAAAKWQEVFQGGFPVELIVDRFLANPNEDVDKLVAQIKEAQAQAKAEAAQFEAQRAMAYNAPDAAEARGAYDGEVGNNGGNEEQPPSEEQQNALPKLKVNTAWLTQALVAAKKVA